MPKKKASTKKSLGYSQNEIDQFVRKGASYVNSMLKVLDVRLDQKAFKKKHGDYAVKRRQLTRLLNVIDKVNAEALAAE